MDYSPWFEFCESEKVRRKLCHSKVPNLLPIGMRVCTLLLYYFFFSATTEYMVGATHLTNGVTLMNTVLAETVNFTPMKIWDNQLDDPAPKQPTTGGGGGGGASGSGGGRQPPPRSR